MAESSLSEDPETQLQNVADENPLATPSFPKDPDEEGFTGSRSRGPNRAFAFTDAESYEERKELSSKLPFRMANGARSLPEDVCGAIRFITERGAGAIKAIWNWQVRKI